MIRPAADRHIGHLHRVDGDAGGVTGGGHRLPGQTRQSVPDGSHYQRLPVRIPGHRPPADLTTSCMVTA
jgi:hypothetical protein